MGITPTGVEFLKKRIEEETVEMPDDMNALELAAWLNGYIACQNNILAIIDEVYNGYRAL